MHAPAVCLRARRCVVGCPLGHSLYARVSCARTQADRACFNRPLQGGPRRLRGGHRHLHQVPLRVNLVATWCPHDCLPLGATRAATTTKTIQKNLSLRMVRPGVVRFHRTRSIHPVDSLYPPRVPAARAARTLRSRLALTLRNRAVRTVRNRPSSNAFDTRPCTLRQEGERGESVEGREERSGNRVKETCPKQTPFTCAASDHLVRHHRGAALG